VTIVKLCLEDWNALSDMAVELDLTHKHYLLRSSEGDQEITNDWRNEVERLENEYHAAYSKFRGF
jgi:archaellum component FlaC